MDFTIKRYRRLIEALSDKGYAFQTFIKFIEDPLPRVIILRHDVEARYQNALLFAHIQHDMGIQGTYFFRFLPNHYDSGVIREIASIGHEIGYHYDDLSHCKGDFDAAIARFRKNISELRQISEIRTICMEGAPLSAYDNRSLWKKYDYHSLGIKAEPYFDLDFTKVFYLTDTGRRWDGSNVSVRDKVNHLTPLPALLEKRGRGRVWGVRYHSTSDIIVAAKAGLLPHQIMMTFHPQRWTDKPLPWLEELVMQNVKNVAKRIVIGAGPRA